DAGHRLLFGVGPTFVFPTATDQSTGQGKWQAGPAIAAAFTPRKWLLGVLAQNPISFAGDSRRPAVNALVLQPFITYQLGYGWFFRSEPQMIFDWETDKQLLPLEGGVGRVFKIGPQYVNCFVEPAWNVSHDGPAPRYAINFGLSLLYPDFWRSLTAW
ncbi:MAG: neuromedin U, partial [Candidatus Binataceae bacterium]